MKIFLAVIPIMLALLVLGCSPAPDAGPSKTAASPSATSPAATTAPPSVTASPMPLPSLELEDYDCGVFSMQKPLGWNVKTAGACGTFSVCIQDRESPVNRIFFFGEVGPVYLAEEQKTIDRDYMDMGGFPVMWYEMPVIDPLTPENFLENFHLLAQTGIAQEFMPGLPELWDIEIISAVEETAFIPGGRSKTIRALFREQGQLGEGLFYITVAPLLPLSGMPGSGIGYGFCFTGITASRAEFKYYQAALYASLSSMAFADDYISDCLAQQQQQWSAVSDIGKTLSETSDIIMDAWESRSRSDDILSEKRSDVMLGNQRVYDPDTGIVYDTPLGFYDDYNINRDRYDMDDLQLLPEDDWDLWTAPTEPVTEIE